ncbi:MAG: hypothetical protein ACLT76_15890 [Clostridium fessum]
MYSMEGTVCFCTCFWCGCDWTDGVLQAEKGTKVPEEPVASFSGCCLSFWILLVPSWGGSDSHQCMASAQGLLQGDFSAWEPVAYSYGTAEGPLGYAYTTRLRTG